MEVKEFFKQAKVGDLVDLRDDLKVDFNYGTDTYIGSMPKPGTKGLKIMYLYKDICKFRTKNSIYNFTPEMVKCVYSADSKQKSEVGKKSVSSIKVGDIVRFRSDLKDSEFNEDTSLTFFSEGPVKAGCIATVAEVSPHIHGKDLKTTIFKVKGSSYYYDSGMLATNTVEEKPDTPYVVKERIVKSVLARVGDVEKVFDFLDQKLVTGNVVKIRENAHKTARYWGCFYLPGFMLKSGRTAKVTDCRSAIQSTESHGNRFFLDKDYDRHVYSVPMFDEVYCITRNPSIYKEFLGTFDVDEVTEKKPAAGEKSTTECKVSVELIKESIKKLQELEKVFEKMLQ